MSHSTGAGPGVATPRPETINHLPDQGSTDYILPVVIVCANYQFDASPQSIRREPCTKSSTPRMDRASLRSARAFLKEGFC